MKNEPLYVIIGVTLNQCESMRKSSSDLQMERNQPQGSNHLIFPDGKRINYFSLKRLVNLGCATVIPIIC